MSQIYKTSTGTVVIPANVATSYVTNSGTAVPALNVLNVLGAADITTSGSGNTVTITGPNLYTTTPVGPIDYTLFQQPYLIYTPPTSNFIVYQIVLLFDNVVGYVQGGTFNLGNNGPTYDNIQQQQNLNPNTNGTSYIMVQSFIGAAYTPASTGIYFVTATRAIQATTATGRIYLIGGFV